MERQTQIHDIYIESSIYVLTLELILEICFKINVDQILRAKCTVIYYVNILHLPTTTTILS